MSAVVHSVTEVDMGHLERIEARDGHMPCPTAAGLKPTNPKDIIGSNKVPMSMVPETALAYAALGLLEGAFGG